MDRRVGDAELGRKVAKREFKLRLPPLREGLLLAQVKLREAGIPALVLFAGVDGAGKGDVVHALNEWMDPRWMVTRAFERPSQDEAERPEYGASGRRCRRRARSACC